jgi:tellurite resistance protein
MQALEAKAPEAVDAYRSFVLEVAASVGNAAGGGEAAESQALERIRSGLGLA